MRGPTIRASAPRHEEQRIAEIGRCGGGTEHCNEENELRDAAAHEPNGDGDGWIVEYADERVRNAEKVRPGRFYDARARDFTPRSPAALAQHEKRGIEPNTAEYRDDPLDNHRVNRLLRKGAALALLVASFLLAYLSELYPHFLFIVNFLVDHFYFLQNEYIDSEKCKAERQNFVTNNEIE